MFLGEYQHTIDPKGRISIPAKFRQLLKEGAVITRGIGDHCLFIYSKTEWEKLAERIATLPVGQAKARALQRLVLGGAMNVEIDKQGRILIPDYLRQYARVEKAVVLAGLFNRIEVWDKEEWERNKKNIEESSSDIAEQLGELGI